MKTYSIKISSNIDPNVEKTLHFNSNLNKEILLDILSPITLYKLTINENPNVIVLQDLEDIIINLIGIKLKTKIAKNITKTNIEQVATFEKRPAFDLIKWEGNSGEIRTYINNILSVTITNIIFPGIFKVDIVSNKAYYPGKLILEYNNITDKYVLTGIKLTNTVIYEEITLEK